MLATARPPGHLLKSSKVLIGIACASTGFLVRACGYTTAHTNIDKLSLTALSPDNYVGTLHMLNYHGTGDT